MPKKDVSIILRARNKMQAGLRNAGAALKKFGGSVAGVGKAMAKGMFVAGAAVAALSVKLLSAFATQQKAVRQVEAAFRAYGEEVPKNTEKVKSFAAAIQDETGVADEQTIAMVGRLKMLGVSTDKLEDAARATIALGKAGLGEAAAIKAVALAHAGDFDTLRRYIPALRTATTDAEKAAIVNDFVSKGYAAQEDELDTLSGRYNEYKGRIGDVMEELGGMLAQDKGLQNMMKSASDGVVRFGQNVAKWIAGGGAKRAFNTWVIFFENMRHEFFKLSNFVHITFSSIGDGIESQLRKMKAALTAAMALASPNIGNIKRAFDEIKKVVVDTSGVTTKRTEKAMAAMEAEAARHAQKIKAIAEEQTAVEVDQAEKGAKEKIKAQKKISIAFENTKKVKIAAEKKVEALAKQVANAEKKAALEVQNAKIAAMQKEQDKRKELAAKTVDAILEEQRAQKQAGEQWQDAQDKARRLRDRMQAGAKPGKKQLAWLAAFEKIEKAKKGIKPGAAAIAGAKGKLEEMQDQGKTLKKIRTELKKQRTQLSELLQRA